MSKRIRSLYIVGLPLALTLCFLPLVANGEGVYPELDTWDLLLSIVENPDPIPQVHWARLDVDPSSPEARTPGERSDGRPAFDFDRATSDPYVVWAYDNGSEHDIAFNRWAGDDWDPKIEYMTASPDDEIDPRIYVDGMNNLLLTWWSDVGDGEIHLMRWEPSRGWGVPNDVTTGRRPSVAVYQGDVVVAFETDRRGGGQQVVFGRSHADEPWVFETVAATGRDARLDPVVHVRAGKLWIDWKSGPASISYAVYDGSRWRAPQARPWLDPSWIGEATVRHEIELEVVP